MFWRFVVLVAGDGRGAREPFSMLLSPDAAPIDDAMSVDALPADKKQFALNDSYYFDK